MANAPFPDPAVWATLFNRQSANLHDKACPEFFTGLQALGFSAAEVPTLPALSARLNAQSGWRIQRVPGIVDAGDFLDLLARQIFPSTYFLRNMAQLDYLEEPDMFHDLFGHLPLLAHPEFSTFYQRLGLLGRCFRQQPGALERIERFYWYTVEFGLVAAGEAVRIYGSGLLSSFGESRQIFQPGVDIRPFCLKDILELPFDKSQMQPVYYAVPDFEFLFGQLGVLEEVLVKNLTA
ncbi:MAG: phenylalanine 4-monooxygenase [Saprospiraceae bacterium]|nr:phenylalanine 4-monooxygenase [Saprospiraceae bacterium]